MTMSRELRKNLNARNNNMLQYDGMYRGIVIQNNDPNNIGRIKTFVPGINLTQIKNWNQKMEEDKFFKYMGSNTKSALTTDILLSQKQKLFWAEVMLPITGMGAPGFYNAPSDSYYIGNDSDYLSQAGNKSAEAFAKDASDAKARLNTTPANPTYGIPPRTAVKQKFYKNGSQYCMPTVCNKDNNGGNSTNNNNSNGQFMGILFPYLGSGTNEALTNITNQIPNVPPLESFIPDVPSTNKSSNINIPPVNSGVVEVIINSFNPTILLNNTPIPTDSSLYNRNCGNIPNIPIGTIPYSPPILYEETDAPAIPYASVPVNITVNGSFPVPNSFSLDSSDANSVTYTQGPLSIVIPMNNISSITIRHNNTPFNIKSILAILPLLSSIAPLLIPASPTSNGGTVIMPRAPMPNGGTMMNRGGGGGEIFNNVSTKLLPTDQRKNSHIGGANNDSRYTVNRGREPLNDKNNVKGANMTLNGGQSHRGPSRAPDYNNDWKGLISIPGVGSHVWIKFENGDTNYPIIIGTYAAQADYKGIYEIP
jgi:hypothetical protein